MGPNRESVLLRVKQDLKSILNSLSFLDTRSEDNFSLDLQNELDYMKKYVNEKGINQYTLIHLLERNFKVYSTIFRLFLTFSKDEYESVLRSKFNEGIGVKAFTKNKILYVQKLIDLGVEDSLISHISRKWEWTDIIYERLKAGRGSAIKGQSRGTALEENIRDILIGIFGNRFDSNCNFMGRVGEAKADFLIPNKESPDIIFEVKGYGATGSKQTDVLGDMGKIIKSKAPRTSLLLITDGVTWNQRQSDLSKLIKMQNEGDIFKIYTSKMFDELRQDLSMLKEEYQIDT